jgi:hypothetical protein
MAITSLKWQPFMDEFLCINCKTNIAIPQSDPRLCGECLELIVAEMQKLKRKKDKK